MQMRDKVYIALMLLIMWFTGALVCVSIDRQFDEIDQRLDVLEAKVGRAEEVE